MGKELNLNYSPTNEKSKTFWLQTTHKNIFSNQYDPLLSMKQWLYHFAINTMPQPGIHMLSLDSSTAYEPFRQARSASALVSILSAVATRTFVSKKERATHFQLCQGHERFVFIPCTCEVQSMCVVGDREMCVHVWVNGGRKGQTRPHKGAWDPGWRDRGRDSEKKGEEQKMEAWMERCRLGLGDWVKAKTGSHLC